MTIEEQQTKIAQVSDVNGTIMARNFWGTPVVHVAHQKGPKDGILTWNADSITIRNCALITTYNGKGQIISQTVPRD